MLGIAAIFIGASHLRQKQPPKMVLFYSDTCPHCKKVEAYINENGIKNKIKFTETEVSNNKDNAALLGTQSPANATWIRLRASASPSSLTAKKCLIGDAKIIELFPNSKIKSVCYQPARHK